MARLNYNYEGPLTSGLPSTAVALAALLRHHQKCHWLVGETGATGLPGVGLREMQHQGRNAKQGNTTQRFRIKIHKIIIYLSITLYIARLATLVNLRTFSVICYTLCELSS